MILCKLGGPLFFLDFLVQIGLQSEKCYLIKLDRQTYKAPNLIKFLSNTKTEFVMHYARQDLLWLKYFEIYPIFL